MKPLKHSVYSKRHSSKIFEVVHEMNSSALFQEKYKKWNDGINFLTNRKIKIAGKTHKSLEAFIFPSPINSCDRYKMFNDIDRLSYEEETERIKQKHKILNSKIEADNLLLKEYNDEVACVITQIKLLDKWEDSIEFEGQSYGIPEVYEMRHRYKNCNGTMLLEREIHHRCGKCEDGMWGCGGGCESWKKVYKCSNCGFEYSC